MVIKKPLVNLQQTWPKFIVALHVVAPSCLAFLCMEFEDGASGLAKWVLIPPFSDARLEGVLQFQRDYTLCQDAGEGNASNSGGIFILVVEDWSVFYSLRYTLGCVGVWPFSL